MKTVFQIFAAMHGASLNETAISGKPMQAKAMIALSVAQCRHIAGGDGDEAVQTPRGSWSTNSSSSSKA